MQVQRYDFSLVGPCDEQTAIEHQPSDEGEWVRHADHLRAIAEKDEVIADLKARNENLLVVLRQQTKCAADLVDKLATFAPFADADGNARKVLGTLPVTADGAIVGHGATIHHPVVFRSNDANHTVNDGATFAMLLAESGSVDCADESSGSRPPYVSWGGPEHDCAGIDECYSTRAAALAAREKEVGDGK